VARSDSGPRPEVFVGQLVDGRWELNAHLGSGRFGDVYSAEPRHLDLAQGAVKIVFPGNQREREEILSEIRALSDLTNDKIVSYRDSGQINDGVMAGAVYVVTELCDGTLADEPDWGMDTYQMQEELRTVVRHVAEGLGYLHDRGLVHGDIKPTNILRAGTSWKISDLGVLQAVAGVGSGTPLRGTPPYLPPEAAAGHGANRQADTYALGVTIHEALTGQWPYDIQNRRWKAPPLATGAALHISDRLPRPWRPVVEMCLRQDPTRRPAAAELVPLIPPPDENTAHRASHAPQASTADMPTLPPRISTRWRAWALFATVSLVLTAALIYSSRDDEAPTPTSAQPLEEVIAPETTPVNPANTEERAPSDVPTSTIIREPSGPANEATTGRDDTPQSSQVRAVVDDWSGSSGNLLVVSDTTLTEDHSGNVVISADGVTLDCDGHRVIGAGVNPGVSIAGRDGVTVTNCDISGFESGITVGNSTNITIEGNVTTGNSQGVVVIDSDAVVRANTATGNSSWGFFIGGTGASTFSDNDAHDNELIGFALNTTAGHQLIGNRATGNDTNFDLNASDNVTLSNNVTEGPGAGFALGNNSGGNTLDGNTFTATEGPSSWGGSVGYSAGSDSNTFTNNTATGADNGFSDGTTGAGTAGTDNTYADNHCVANDRASTPVGLCRPEGPSGYRLLEADGSVYSCGLADQPCTRGNLGRVTHFGDPRGDSVMGSATAVAMASTPSFQGYNVLLSDGRVLAYGDAPDLGGTVAAAAVGPEQVAAISMTPTGKGYWVFTTLGRVTSFGDATHFGDLPTLSITPADDIVASVAVADGSGYYMLGADGGVFAFPVGVTPFHGSIPQVLPGVQLGCPIVGLVPTPSAAGYWMVGCDGGVFAFGDAFFVGSLPGLGLTDLNAPVNGMVAFGGAGYLMVATDGGAFNFGAPFFGSLGAAPTDTPVVATNPYLS